MRNFRLLFLFLLIGAFSCSTDEKPEIVVQAEVKPPQRLNLTASEFPIATFTDPQKIIEGTASPEIFNQLISFIDATPQGSSIHMSIYLFEYAPVIEALKQAHARKVNLHIMVDKSDRSNNSSTVNELTRLGEGIEIIEVQNDASSIAINHNKFVLFSEVEAENGLLEKIIFQTSHNFVKSSMKKLQDALVFHHSELYDSYRDYFQKMTNLSRTGMKNYTYFQYTDPAEEIIAQFYPKRKDGDRFGEDSVLEIFRNITDPETTTIKIGMSAWADSRAFILEELNDLLLMGANIEIITKSGQGPEVMSGLQKLKNNGAFIKVFNMGNNIDVPKINIHTKLMMIDGIFEGEEKSFVMTGTQNFTNNGIWNNNEVSLLLFDQALFQEYEQYFNQLKDLPGIDLTGD